MSTLLRSVFKSSTIKCLANSLRQNEACFPKRQFTRTLWHMCPSMNGEGRPKNLYKAASSSKLCSCGCGIMHAHTKSEKELVDFLSEEITQERKLLKSSTIPVEVDGFKVKLNGSEVTLTKTAGDEIIEVNFNVNHSVDTDVEPEINQTANKPQLGEMKSKPVFEVEINRGGRTLGFTCSFLSSGESQSDDGYNDLFAIDEVTLYEGDWKDTNYAVSGEILDGYLYDLLMNFLDDKGITNEFVEKLTEFSTVYEHNSYISLLESLKKFASGN
ncbi:complement C1q binding protein P32 [Lycorma delicatula]|uniref:complement C1q binding protein P32 n=1 Tax=Lycorma delicatula TaxID=130591 RepID=UPI003F5161F1